MLELFSYLQDYQNYDQETSRSHPKQVFWFLLETKVVWFRPISVWTSRTGTILIPEMFGPVAPTITAGLNILWMFPKLEFSPPSKTL